MRTTRRVLNHDGGAVVCERCEIADGFWSRFRGLMGRKTLASGEGLLLRPSSSIHTLFMRFPIDAVFLDEELRVVAVQESLRPWNAAMVRGAKAVLELPAGEARGLELSEGTPLRIEGEEKPDPPAVEVLEGAPADRPTPGISDLGPAYRNGAIAAAVLGVAAVLAHFGLDERGAISAVLVAALAVLSAFDLRFRVIPNRIVLPAAALVLALQLVLFSDDAVEWLAAGFGGALVMLLPGLIRPGAIGFGDVKLTLLLGFGLGGSIVTALLLGSLCAVPVALWILVRGGMEARKEAIPLGPFLAFGGFLALLISDSL